jgi:hypothetical protein
VDELLVVVFVCAIAVKLVNKAMTRSRMLFLILFMTVKFNGERITEDTAGK